MKHKKDDPSIDDAQPLPVDTDILTPSSVFDPDMHEKLQSFLAMYNDTDENEDGDEGMPQQMDPPEEENGDEHSPLPSSDDDSGDEHDNGEYSEGEAELEELLRITSPPFVDPAAALIITNALRPTGV